VSRDRENDVRFAIETIEAACERNGQAILSPFVVKMLASDLRAVLDELDRLRDNYGVGLVEAMARGAASKAARYEALAESAQALVDITGTVRHTRACASAEIDYADECVCWVGPLLVKLAALEGLLKATEKEVG